eukprot:378201-Prymnesium_polylepis.1
MLASSSAREWYATPCISASSALHARSCRSASPSSRTFSSKAALRDRRHTHGEGGEAEVKRPRAEGRGVNRGHVPRAAV